MPEPEPHELSDLVVIMAHDLKNPLAALMTNLHYLQGALSGPGANAREALDESVSLCEVLERFLRNLDLIARKQEVIGRRQVVAVGAVAHEATNRAQSQALAAGIDVMIETESFADPMVLVDRDLFTRALENVIANAVENAPGGSTVRIEVTGGEPDAVVIVTDARDQLPVLWSGLLPGALHDGKRQKELYGRGLALLCADLAARAAGARLEIAGAPGACRLSLVAPVRE